MTLGRPLTISSIPNPFPANPYLDLLYEHLARHGIAYVPSERLSITWLRAQRHQIGFLHFHWPSYQYSDRADQRSPAAALRLAAQLAAARAMGYRVIWTVHNLYPHESAHIVVEWLYRLNFVHSIDLLFVHFEDARDDLRRHFGRRRGVHVVPHGSYRPRYPEIPDRATARRALGLSTDERIWLCFGQVRPYKGIEAAIEAVRRLGDPTCRLYVVGKRADEGYVRHLGACVGNDSRVRLVLSTESLPDEQLANWLAASDWLVAPYRRVYTSGVAYLAATFGRAVVAPRMGLFRSLVRSGFVETYDPSGGIESLTAALARARSLDPDVVRTAAADFEAAHDWDTIAQRVRAILASDG